MNLNLKMGRSILDCIAELPKERQKAIELAYERLLEWEINWSLTGSKSSKPKPECGIKPGT